MLYSGSQLSGEVWLQHLVYSVVCRAALIMFHELHLWEKKFTTDKLGDANLNALGTLSLQVINVGYMIVVCQRLTGGVRRDISNKRINIAKTMVLKALINATTHRKTNRLPSKHMYDSNNQPGENGATKPRRKVAKFLQRAQQCG